MTNKKADVLLNEVIEANREKNKSDRKVEELEKDMVKEAHSSTEHIKNLQSTVAEQANQISIMNQTIKDMSLEKKSLVGDSTRLSRELVDMTTSKQTETESLRKLWDLDRVRAEKAEKTIKELKEKLALNLKGYSKWTRVFSLFKK